MFDHSHTLNQIRATGRMSLAGHGLAAIVALTSACTPAALGATPTARTGRETYEAWSCRELPRCESKPKTMADVMCEAFNQCDGMPPARYATEDERIDARLERFSEEWRFCQQEMRAILNRLNQRVLWLYPAVEDKVELVFINDWSAKAYSDPRALKIYVSAGLCHQVFVTAAAMQSYGIDHDDAAAERYVMNARSAIEKLAQTVPYGGRSLDLDFYRIDARSGFNQVDRSAYVVPSLLYIIAHETGHLVLKHRPPATSDDAWASEYAADKFAYTAMKRAEYAHDSEPTLGASMAILNSAPALLSPEGAPLARHPPSSCRLFSTLQYSDLFKTALEDGASMQDAGMQALIEVAKKGVEINWSRCAELLQGRH